MKTTHSFCIMLMLTLASMKSYAQQNFLPLSFQAATLHSGTALAAGAVYKFTNVVTGIDAFVKIDSLVGGATVFNMDTVGTGYGQAFQPRVRSVSGASSYAVFTITFKKPSGSDTLLPLVCATALDIDGNADYKEFAEIDMKGGRSFFYSDTTHLSLEKRGTAYRATNSKGVEFTGIDTLGYPVMFGVEKASINSIVLRLGTNLTKANSSATRNFSILFQKISSETFAALPVQFRSIKVNRLNQSNVLQWQVTGEGSIEKFQVEKSSDGITFQPIQVLVTGNTHTYQYVDVRGGHGYYRVLALSGEARRYSDIVSVSNSGTNVLDVSCYPNPATHSVRYHLPASFLGRSVQLVVQNAAGEVVIKKPVNSNSSTESLVVNKLPVGLYWVTVSGGEVFAKFSFLKL